MFHKGKHDREKQLRFSIRKVSFGAASVAVAALFMFLGNGAVSAAEQGVPSTNGETQAQQPKDQNAQNGTYEGNTVATSPAATVETNTQPSKVENSPSPESAPQKVGTLDKKELTDLIREIDGKFAKGTYATKTEESVNNLRTVLEEARTDLSTATTQTELTVAYRQLITATSKLQTKSEKKKEQAVDNPSDKGSEGKKNASTEKTLQSNSIVNSGSRDERNGKALDANNPFRTDAATTNTDPTANQTYTAPAEDADLNTLVQKLKELDPTVENNTKISQNMDSLGDSKQVEKGAVKEITEFGGWTAIDGGVFAIARRTEEGVYPLETINSTLDDTVWLQEQAFDRDAEYTLLLSKSITRANRDEAAWDGSAYKPTGAAGGVTKNVAKYKGIEKIFTAYSSKEGSDVIVKFKPGYVGDSEGSKANYKIQVYSITGNQETLVYETTFDPSVAANDDKKIVTKATDGTNKAKIRISKTPNSTTIDSGIDHTTRKEFIGKREAEKLMAKPENLPNGKAGTFTSKPIELPKGADHYKVRISLADQNRTGMSYQAWDEKYSIPVTGADFSIAQDTSKVARNLLQRIYDKLKATESADKNGKTAQTVQEYEAELEKVRTLLADPAARTANFKQALQDLLAKQSGLKTDKTGLTNSKAELDALINEDPTVGKTEDTVNAYNTAKEAAKAEITEALKVLNDESATPEQVSATLEKVNAKKAALQKAKDGLIEAATTEEKAKLKADADSLVKADETGKTPESIKAYNRKYEALKAQLEAAKTEAATVLAKADNASKAEVQAAQTKVDAAKAELTKAAELLVNKADKTELTQAKEALSTLATEADPTTGKTADSAKAYNDAKTAAQEAVKEAETVINDENVTPEKVTEALNKVNEKKAALEAAKQALVEAATTEEKAKLKADADSLVKADETGKTPESIKAYNRKYEALKAQLEAAKTEAATVLAKADNASKAEVQAAQTKVDAAKAELTKAAELLVNKADKTELTQAKEALSTLATEADPTTGKTADSAKAYNDAKTDAQEAIKTAETVINDENATPEQVTAALNKVNEKKTALQQAKDGLIEAATVEEKAKLKSDADLLTKADETGKTPDSIAVYERKYEELKDQLEVAKAEADKVLAKGNNATKEEVKAAQAKVDAVKTELETAKNILVEAATTEEKTKLKTDSDALKKADTTGKTADSIKAYGAEFEKLKAQLEETKAEADKVLAKGNNATKEEVKAAQEKVDAVKTALDKAAESLKDLDRDAAKKEIADAAKKATDAIEASTSLTLEQKAEEKSKVAKEAKDATDAIDNATTEEGINSAKENGKLAIEKEAAISAVKATKEAKLSEIDKNTSLSDDEKAASKAEVAKAAIEAVEAIQKATTQEAVNEVQAKGETAIKAVNPIGKEKALDAIQKAAEEKIAEIDKNAKLSAEEKAAAKAEVAKAAIETVEAIQKAETQEAVNTAQAKGEATIKAVNPVGKAQAKAAIDKALAEKEKAIDARTDLTDAEKEVAKKSARAEAESAKKAIDNATDSEAVEKALRTFLYQIDQESLVYNRPTFNLEAYIQASITGVVKVERGKAITQADIISKLSLPENVTVISIDLPDTNTLGDKFAKVMLRLPDGTEVTVKVPVRVVASQNGDSKPEIALPDYGRSNGSTNTEATVDKAKLEGAIRQLDELIIQESAKFDSETSKEATALSADAKKVFANADVSQAEVDAMVKRIEDFMAKVASSTDHTTPANDQAAQTPAVAPSTAQAAANAGQTASAQANARKAAKELPNTGTADSTVAMVAAAASALLGLSLAGRRRKEDEEA